MSNEIVVFDAPELETIEKSKAQKIKDTFEPMAKMLSSFEDAFNEVVKLSEKGIDHDVISKAKRLRLCLLYTSPSPRDLSTSRMPSSA